MKLVFQSHLIYTGYQKTVYQFFWSNFESVYILFKLMKKKLVYCEYHYPLTFQEYEAACFPHRSTTFATNFQHRSLEYCDSIIDSDMEDIVAVCRGSLIIIDYYKWVVKHRLLRLNRFEIKGNTKLDVEVDTQ